MPTKRKKYDARFSPSRIKRIMQSDEEVGKIGSSVPVIMSRALEMFLESLLTEASDITKSRGARTLTTSHLRAAILKNDRFSLLRDLMASINDGSCSSSSSAIPKDTDNDEDDDDGDDYDNTPSITTQRNTAITSTANSINESQLYASTSATAETTSSGLEPPKELPAYPKSQSSDAHHNPLHIVNAHSHLNTN